jgi:uncharacterized protein
MRKSALLFVLAVCLATSSFAAQGAAATRTASDEALPPDAATAAQIMTLFDSLQVRRNMIAMIASMKQSLVQGMEQTLRSKIPNPTPKQLKEIKVTVDAALDDMPIDDLIKAMVPVYQRHFTKTDIEELIRFYASPVGQKYLREQPQVMQETMQASMQITQNRMKEVELKVEKRLQELNQEGTATGK